VGNNNDRYVFYLKLFFFDFGDNYLIFLCVPVHKLGKIIASENKKATFDNVRSSTIFEEI
jgi:hypothetical protein